MRVGCVHAVENPQAQVGFTRTGGVLQKDEVGTLLQQDAAVPELEAGRAMQVIGEDGHLVGAAGPLGVFEDDKLVVHVLLGLPVGIGGPDGHP